MKQTENSSTGKTASDEAIIEIKGMHKWYGEFHVLKDINLRVSKGERIVVCGPSGSGKTTLVKLLSTLIIPTSGTIRILGYDIRQETLIKRVISGFE